MGQVVNKDDTKLDLNKIEAVLHFPKLKMVTNIRSFLGLTWYYRNYVQSYSRLVALLFELTKNDIDFVWNLDYQQAFQALKGALVDALVLIRLDFKKQFCLDVDWSPKGVGAILSQKEGNLEKVVAYVNKSLTKVQRKFHPMEGKCYALIWGIMHFTQHFHRNHLNGWQ